MDLHKIMRYMQAYDLRMDGPMCMSDDGLCHLTVTDQMVYLPVNKDRSNDIPIRLEDLSSFRWEADGEGMMHLVAVTYDGEFTGTGRIPGSEPEFRISEGAGQRKMPKTLLELSTVFRELYPGCEDKLFYDELLDRVVVDMGIFGRPKEGLQPYSDSIRSIYYEDMERRLGATGFIGTPPSYLVRDHVLNIYTHNNSRNRFREWIESLEWDGVPRLRTIFKDLFGGTAPALRDLGTEDRYLGDVAEAWFLGAVRRAYCPAKHEIVPVLIGDQGIGKGLALKYLAGRDEWYKDTLAKVDDPKKFAENVQGAVILELSESSQIKSADIEELKGFISIEVDRYRNSYDRYTSDHPRKFILVATSNRDTVFVDQTGNRRFFPIYCDPDLATLRFSSDRRIGQDHIEQVWAEAVHMYRNNHRWYLSKESRGIAYVMQKFCTRENPRTSRVDAWLDLYYPSVGDRVTRAMIIDGIMEQDERLSQRDAEEAYSAWDAGKQGWEKNVRPMRIDGTVQRGFKRILPPGVTKVIKQLCIVDPDAEGCEKEDPLTVLRRQCDKEGQMAMEKGDIVSMDGVSPEMVAKMVEEGYITESTSDGVTRYFLENLL